MLHMFNMLVLPT